MLCLHDHLHAWGLHRLTRRLYSGHVFFIQLKAEECDKQGIYNRVQVRVDYARNEMGNIRWVALLPRNKLYIVHYQNLCVVAGIVPHIHKISTWST